MVPHRIFYIWLGKSKRPQSVDMCIRNWRQMLPDSFEIIEIGESPGPWFDLRAEMRRNRWLGTVYERKMWAFVSDYVRCKLLYEHGGVYLDTDVTLEKDLTPLLESDKLFLGRQDPELVNFSIGGAPARNPVLGALLQFYEEEIWHSPLAAIPDILTYILRTRFHWSPQCSDQKASLPEAEIYPPKYFYPHSYGSDFSPACITQQTYSIHWWGESWVNPEIQYFLRHKHEPGFDLESKGETCKSLRIRLLGAPLLTIKTSNGVSRCWLFGFLPIMRLSESKGSLFGIFALSVKEKETRV